MRSSARQPVSLATVRDQASVGLDGVDQAPCAAHVQRAQPEDSNSSLPTAPQRSNITLNSLGNGLPNREVASTLEPVEALSAASSILCARSSAFQSHHMPPSYAIEEDQLIGPSSSPSRRECMDFHARHNPARSVQQQNDQLVNLRQYLEEQQKCLPQRPDRTDTLRPHIGAPYCRAVNAAQRQPTNAGPSLPAPGLAPTASGTGPAHIPGLPAQSEPFAGPPPAPANGPWPLAHPQPRAPTPTERLSGFGSRLTTPSTGTSRDHLHPFPASLPSLTATRSPLTSSPVQPTAPPPGPAPPTAPHAPPTATLVPPQTTRVPARSGNTTTAPPASLTSPPATLQSQPTDPRASAEASGRSESADARGTAVGAAATTATGSAAGGSGGFREILVTKVLTKTDVLKRYIILPKVVVEASMPEVVARQAHRLIAHDPNGACWLLVIRKWVNGRTTPTYVLEHISEFVKAYNVTVGDVVGIARNPDGSHSIEVNTQDMIQHALRNAPSLGRLRHHLREKPDAAAAAEAEDAEEGEGRPPPPAHPLPQPGPRGLTHTEHLSGFGSGLAPLTTGTGRGPLRPSPASPSLVTATRSPLPLCPAPHTARPPGPTPSTAPHSRPTAAPSPPRTTRTPARSISAPPASPTSLPAMRQPQPTDPRAGAEASGGVAGRTAGGAAAGRAGTGSAAGGSGGVRKILVAKALTQSDALYRRITLPRRLVEVNMPEVVGRQTYPLWMHDAKGVCWRPVIRTWTHKSKPIYVLEHISEFFKAHNVREGDVVGIARCPDGSHSIEVNARDLIQHMRNTLGFKGPRCHRWQGPDAAATAAAAVDREAEDEEAGEGPVEAAAAEGTVVVGGEKAQGPVRRGLEQLQGGCGGIAVAREDKFALPEPIQQREQQQQHEPTPQQQGTHGDTHRQPTAPSVLRTDEPAASPAGVGRPPADADPWIGPRGTGPTADPWIINRGMMPAADPRVTNRGDVLAAGPRVSLRGAMLPGPAGLTSVPRCRRGGEEWVEKQGGGLSGEGPEDEQRGRSWRRSGEVWEGERGDERRLAVGDRAEAGVLHGGEQQAQDKAFDGRMAKRPRVGAWADLEPAPADPRVGPRGAGPAADPRVTPRGTWPTGDPRVGGGVDLEPTSGPVLASGSEYVPTDYRQDMDAVRWDRGGGSASGTGADVSALSGVAGERLCLNMQAAGGLSVGGGAVVEGGWDEDEDAVAVAAAFRRHLHKSARSPQQQQQQGDRIAVRGQPPEQRQEQQQQQQHAPEDCSGFPAAQNVGGHIDRALSAGGGGSDGGDSAGGGVADMLGHDSAAGGIASGASGARVCPKLKATGGLSVGDVTVAEDGWDEDAAAVAAAFRQQLRKRARSPQQQQPQQQQDVRLAVKVQPLQQPPEQQQEPQVRSMQLQQQGREQWRLMQQQGVEEAEQGEAGADEDSEAPEDAEDPEAWACLACSPNMPLQMESDVHWEQQQQQTQQQERGHFLQVQLEHEQELEEPQQQQLRGSGVWEIRGLAGLEHRHPHATTPASFGAAASTGTAASSGTAISSGVYMDSVRAHPLQQGDHEEEEQRRQGRVQQLMRQQQQQQEEWQRQQQQQQEQWQRQRQQQEFAAQRPVARRLRTGARHVALHPVGGGDDVRSAHLVRGGCGNGDDGGRPMWGRGRGGVGGNGGGGAPGWHRDQVDAARGPQMEGLQRQQLQALQQQQQHHYQQQQQRQQLLFVGDRWDSPPPGLVHPQGAPPVQQAPVGRPPPRAFAPARYLHPQPLQSQLFPQPLQAGPQLWPQGPAPHHAVAFPCRGGDGGGSGGGAGLTGGGVRHAGCPAGGATAGGPGPE